jgi:hypothetical protein
MNEKEEGIRFLKWFLLCFGAGSIAICSWNYVVDPFDIYHGRTRHGFNHFKGRSVGAFDRMSKAHQISRLKPEGLIAGTSRVDWALDPSHPALQKVSPGYYNAGLAGATMYEVYRYVQHAHRIQPLKQVVLGLDLEMFNADEVRESFNESRMAVRADGVVNPWFRLPDLVPTLFSHDAIVASRDTIRKSKEHVDITWDDIMNRGSDFHEKPPPEESWRVYRVGVRSARHHLGNLADRWDRISDRMKWFEALLAFSQENRIDLHIFITPYHLSHLDVIRRSGNWNMFNRWKRKLVQLNAVTARSHGNQPFPLWDFSGYHPVAVKPFPTEEDPYLVMKWYRESSHYRKITGDMILDRMLGIPIGEHLFGAPLTAQNLNFILDLQQQLLQKYLKVGLPEHGTRRGHDTGKEEMTTSKPAGEPDR